MRFDSAEFLIFFIVVLVLHRVLKGRRTLLVVASYAFYSSWNPPFLLLLWASTALDYTLGRKIEETEAGGRRRALLALSLLGNLGVLAYFKYVNFFLSILIDAGIPRSVLSPFFVNTQIPLGISFYTFQTISYTVDVYRRQIPACRSVADFALFVAFFPQLIAGPIIRASQFIPQIRNNKVADHSQVLQGLELCLIGLFKKVVLADNFAILVDRCFANPEDFSGFALLLGTFAFSVQIFCDFSGYSTIARGLARMLGYDLPRNFAFPLISGNPIEYRRGWHMTMGAWFRDYMYRPLGGDRVSLPRMCFNTMLTWTAFGLWHGASWTFVVWGAYNGVLLTAYRLLHAANLLSGRSIIYTVLGYLTMPFFVGFANVFFRSTSIDSALLIIGRIFTWAPGVDVNNLGWALGLISLYVLHWINRAWLAEGLLVRVGWPARFVLLGGMVSVLYLFAGSGAPFYYFQF